MSNLIAPPTYLRVPTNSQEIVLVKARDICFIEESLGGETTVWHLVGNDAKFFTTSLSANDIEIGIRDLDTKWEEYNDDFMNRLYGDK
jgi:hypothetical protein